MADVHTPDAIPATNASNTTRYFHLPLFISTDKPSWLVDWNGAMGEIDTILQNINTASEGAVADVQTIQTQIDALNQLIPNLEATVQTAVSDVAAMQTTVAAQKTRLDSVEQDLITQNNLVKQLSDAVVAMQSTVATLNNRVQVMETALQGVEVDVNTIRSQITSLDNRVTALEQGGAGSSLPDITAFTQDPMVRNHNDFPSSAGEVTLWTAAADGYAYITKRALSNHVGLHEMEMYVNSDAHPVLKMGVYSNQPTGASTADLVIDEGISPIFKVKQGDVIKGYTNNWLYSGATEDDITLKMYFAPEA